MKKAAILLSIIDPGVAQTILEELKLSKSQLQSLSDAMDNYDTSSKEEVEEVCSIVIRESESRMQGIDNSSAKSMLHNMLNQDNCTWQQVNTLSPKAIASYLDQERPEIISAIITNLDRNLCTEVISLLSPDLANSVIISLLDNRRLHHKISSEIGKGMAQKITSDETQQDNTHNELISILFDTISENEQSNLIKQIEPKDQKLAENLKKCILSFEDIETLESKDMQKLISAIDKNDIPMALKGCSESLQGQFFNNISERATRILKEDMDIIGSVSTKDVASVQKKILSSLKSLIREGAIKIGNQNEQEDMIS